MLILPQTVIITWNNQYKKYYEDKGYIFTKINDKFEVNVLDLTLSSNIKVKYICDYCGIEYERIYKRLNTSKDNDKLCCNKCHYKKCQETIIEKYNVDNISKSDIINKNKSKKIKEKLNNIQIKEKIQKTNLQKYGAKSPVESKIIQEKIKTTCMKNFGVEKPWQSPEIREKIRINANKTMYKNGTAPCTKPQKYIYELLNTIQNCELNYPINRLWLDIAYPNEMIYIEYDGAGHDKQVKCGWKTQEEFYKKEMDRQYYLKNKGWKLIRILSNDDKLPDDKKIIELINECKNYLLNTDHTWIKINLNEQSIECVEYKKIFKT